MQAEYYPWKVEFDVDKTKKYYAEHDLAENKEDNDTVMRLLSEKQRAFFEMLGVDLSRVRVERTDFAGDKGKTLYEVRFLMSGSLKAIPSFQAQVYTDPETFGKRIRKLVEVVDMDPAKTLEWKNKDKGNNIDGMMVSFKHPGIFYDEDEFRDWDCGYVCGIALLKQKKQKMKKEVADLKIRREDMPSLPYGLHDVHIRKIRLQQLDESTGNVTFLLQNGIYSTDRNLEPVPANLLFQRVELDFANVYVMKICGMNHGKIKGHKYSLKKFLKKYRKADIEIIDETYGYNRSKFSGYLYEGDDYLEIMIELYHVGGMYYLVEGEADIPESED
ncbi:MAG: hypothetical protein ACI4FX_05150 [Agathobacter sp.]